MAKGDDPFLLGGTNFRAMRLYVSFREGSPLKMKEMSPEKEPNLKGMLIFQTSILIGCVSFFSGE